jgi:hypothetical protein
MAQPLKRSNREPRPLKRRLRDTRDYVIAVGEVLLFALIFLRMAVDHVKAILGK